MSKIIIGLVGPIACGKEVIKKYLAEKYRAKYCRFSDSLRDVVRRLDIEESRENLQDLSTMLRQRFGEDLLAKAVILSVSKLDSDVVVVDGIRRMADIRYLNGLPNFHLIKVEADPKIRYERAKSRNENVGDKDKTFEEFLADEKKESEQEIPIVMANAKISIANEGNLEELYAKVEEIMSELTNKF